MGRKVETNANGSNFKNPEKMHRRRRRARLVDATRNRLRRKRRRHVFVPAPRSVGARTKRRMSPWTPANPRTTVTRNLSRTVNVCYVEKSKFQINEQILRFRRRRQRNGDKANFQEIAGGKAEDDAPHQQKPKHCYQRDGG